MSVDAQRSIRIGYLSAITCNLIWGFLPLYFRLLDRVGALEIVAHRIIWSICFLLIILTLRRRLSRWLKLLVNLAVIRLMVISALLIGCNWLIYIWAVNHGHVVAVSLGYFLNPLASVALGFIVLKERLSRAQVIAVVFAAGGVSIMAFRSPDGLWISLAIAASFSLYGLVRKMAPVDPLEGLATETLLLAPIMVIYLSHAWLTEGPEVTRPQSVNALLILSALMTSVPLMLFASAARRLTYGTLGLFQYLGPTIQLLLGAFLFAEPVNLSMLFCFALIWTGLAVLIVNALMTYRRRSQHLRSLNGSAD